MASKGLMIAGLASGSGKTMVTLGLLRALARRGKAPAAGKTG
ncbi:MAG: AAA family ATPase, partial [Alphaproteobacteria bacterium]|nr:AAA family ATPase [Alphaproteobacteria bacterium]